MNLVERISAEIRQKGPMPFVEFMHQALYTPNLGYYCSDLQKFGVQGDYITAPEISPLFGQAMAHQCQQLLQHLDQAILFEFGAGSGRLCVDILAHLERLGCLPQEYHILEVSRHLQKRQQELLQANLPHLYKRVKWLSRWPGQPFNGVVIANEVLDAMPVHRFLQTDEGLLECYIRLNSWGELEETYQPCNNPRLISHVQTVLPSDLIPYQSEANLFIDDWMQQCFSMLKQGALLLVDYGYPRQEYYHPERQGGTFTCISQHRTNTHSLARVGEQDMTAHVDFTHVAEAGHAAGFHVAGFTNQASFLLANGLLSLLESPLEERMGISAKQAVIKLTQPNEMGELFKVIALTKNLDLDLTGFQLLDKRVSL